MSREIKLRVWDAARQCFTPLTSLDQLSGPANLSQSTGVVDYFGKEIWEGDIVKWNNFDPSTGVYHECYFVVGFQGGCFGTCGADDEAEFTPYESATCCDVVVGNVYVDSCLLTQNLELSW